ncbi:uncharacterized protein N7479_009360 [Penicillium vulpinum]|nr:uncharacterized protein N7479_009360 [Penicillium vulpinum]KAJ5950947.1 hypothetical protein N7479_009360 [Penicillium vulpinum]
MPPISRNPISFIKSEQAHLNHEIFLARGAERYLEASFDILEFTLTAINEETRLERELYLVSSVKQYLQDNTITLEANFGSTKEETSQ